MTILNANVHVAPLVFSFSGISAGTCDASNNWNRSWPDTHPTVTIVSQTDGVSPPSSNVTTVKGSFGGMLLTISPTGAGAANDGSHATFKYLDNYDTSGGDGGYTGGADLHIDADCVFQAPGLMGASSYPGVNISTLGAVTPATLDAGQRVAAKMGDVIRFKSGYAGASASIVCQIAGLTLIDRLPLRSDGSVSVQVNLNYRETAWSIKDVTVADVNGTTIPAVVVNYYAAGNAPGGLILTNLGMNAAALTARMTQQVSGGFTTSLTFK